MTPSEHGRLSDTEARIASSRANVRLLVVLALVVVGLVVRWAVTREPDPPVRGEPVLWISDPLGSSPRLIPGSADVADPVWSPDGRLIAFSRNGWHGFSNIWVMNSDGSSQRRLTKERTGADDEAPVWSPDGSFIAFTRSLDGKAWVYAVDQTGGNLRRLASGVSHPVFTPDGKALVGGCGEWQFSVCQVPLDNPRAVKRLVTIQSGSVAKPAVSMQGRIAYGNESSLYVLDFPGAAPRKVADRLNGPTHPAWAPDGKIIFSRRALFLVDPDVGPGSERQLTFNEEGASAPSVNPKTGQLAFTHTTNRRGVFSMSADGSQVAPRFENGVASKQAAASPDGNWIAWVDYRDGFAALYRAAADGTDLLRLTSFPEGVANPAWSGDSRSIAFIRTGVTERSPKGIWIVDVHGGHMRPLPRTNRNAGHPTWMPDGSRIVYSLPAFASSTGHYASIVVYELRTGRERVLKLQGGTGLPAFGPDGQLAYVRFESRGNDIYIADADGRGERRLTHDGRVKDGISWSPGREILYWSRDGIYAVDVSSGATRLVKAGIFDRHPSWTLDGRILFDSQR
jgi:Tol biopolymer transport system component